jgi:hypothetical protein
VYGVFHGFLDRDRRSDRLPVDVLHHEVIRPDIIQRADVGMIQRGNRAGSRSKR